MVWTFLIIILVVLGIAACTKVISGRNNEAELKYNEKLTSIVKHLMTEGIYYDSTDSAEPLYDGERPTISLDPSFNADFNKLCGILKAYGHKDWVIDLQEKKAQVNGYTIESSMQTDTLDGVTFVESVNKEEHSSRYRMFTFVWIEIMALLGFLFGEFNKNALIFGIMLLLLCVSIIGLPVLSIVQKGRQVPLVKGIKQRRVLWCLWAFCLCFVGNSAIKGIAESLWAYRGNNTVLINATKYNLFDIDSSNIFAIFIIGLLVVFIANSLYQSYKRNPFALPVIEITLDITGRKKPSYKDCIEQYILDHPNYDIKNAYDKELKDWTTNCERQLGQFILWRNHRQKQYAESKDSAYSKYYEIFHWVFVRQQTRYKQVDYQKYSYVVDNVEHISEYTLAKMLELRENLEKIGFELTTEKYFARDQRRLMTRELREEIMKRDNYTCQKCGKYMPDEVGLEIDHIIPIKKGGKSIRSNLQVLCDNCNSKKRACIFRLN